MPLHTTSFTQNHIDDAAALLAARHRADRTRSPTLPSGHDDAESLREPLRKALTEPGAGGVVAFQGGRMAGYQLGGMLLQASLGFGIEQAHALCDLRDLDGTSAAPPSFEVRCATHADIDAVLAIVRQLRTHQAASPVYGVALPEHIATRSDAIELLDDPAMTLWLACQDGAPVSVVLMGATTPDATTPERCIELKIGVTDRNVRGTGAGRHIVAHALRHARVEGMEWCKADWRATNVEAARFWPRQGFVPIVYRLFRHVDERIAWARG
jgi:GNAT superfamily N-acetyltransferase